MRASGGANATQQIEGGLGQRFLELARFGAQVLYLIRGCFPCRVAGQPLLAGFEELLGPAIIEVLGNALLAAKLGDAVLATQAFDPMRISSAENCQRVTCTEFCEQAVPSDERASHTHLARSSVLTRAMRKCRKAKKQARLEPVAQSCGGKNLVASRVRQSTRRVQRRREL